MKKIHVFILILLLLGLFITIFTYLTYTGMILSINDETSDKKQSDFKFQVPEVNMIVTTSKRRNAQFYVMFSDKDNISLSDSVDYIEVETMNAIFNIIFDSTHKKNIYFSYPRIKKVNQVKYQFHMMTDNEISNRFSRKSHKKQSDILCYPHMWLSIYPSTYGIVLEYDSIIKKWIKDGDIYGGW